MVTEIELFESTDTILIVGLEEARSLQKKGGYTRRIVCSHFGSCCQHKETYRSPQTNNTRSSHKSCKVHWGWTIGDPNIYSELSKICHFCVQICRL